ncbi:hypothetical protein QBC46DRAFT_392037 [Diplogelasinospora grovesii]|uniref:Uncharacterized protein n=1 Tax=Diplogelasinospora grovesii TaxID=303347 RepID=A0AAN6N2S4_9PEZI|nr:hypothetical protein QBC46DRAFT_392037 [Diplogelasinospora grovesii]
MCGHETPSSTPRVGARVDLFSRSEGFLGNLVFLDPSIPDSALATHVRFTPRVGATMDDRVLVSIHLTGDLTKPIEDCGLLQRFTLPSAGQSKNDEGIEMALDKSLMLGVGQDGIIGRRVSMARQGRLLADGIIGFNSMLPVSASL